MNQYKAYIKRFYKEILIRENIKSMIFILILSLLKVVVVMIPPILTMKILDEFIPNNRIDKIIVFSVFILILTVTESLFKYILSYLYSNFSKRVFIYFQKRCIKHLFCLSGDFYTNISSGDLFTTIYQDIGQIKGLVSNTVFEFVSDITIGICMFAFLFYLQWDLLLILCIIMPIIVISQKYFQKAGRAKSVQLREGYGKLNGILENVITNIIPFTYSNAKEYFNKKYNKIVEDATDKEVQIQLISSKNSGILNFLAALFNIIIFGYGGAKVIAKTFSIGGLMAFAMYSQKLIMPILKVSGVLMEMQSILVSLEKIYLFLDTKTIAEDYDESASMIIKSSGNKIDYIGIGFCYNDSKSVIQSVNLTFEPGQFNVIVGESGSGKSTLLSLLYRFWEPQYGVIQINGTNINKLKLDYLRKQIMIVSQDMYLFDDTIYNNIVLGGTKNQSEVENAAKKAYIHDYIISLPDGYQTFIGEKGVRLSGGEKQRLCLARALLSDSPILILDESTSALDQLLEKKVLRNIIQSLGERTLIVITHRLQSIVEANNIYILKDGNIIEKGKHNELLIKSPYYKQLFERKDMIDL